ncbi:MAG TPA: Asp-tRNA(Asn)/Glu-tRNA(Gln) amidotransferase subunit GatC [Desulfosalsimonadaceae bacterium]|nr:Asp-tRNA(Asn)/Glu-tRNA(Gln) amidotransferase subunit GatC [Desulfosalsimonadaceae bacterium]
MKISREEVLHVADLARLTVDDEAVGMFAEQLGSILEYVEKLGAVDTSGITPTAHAVEMANAFRKDDTTHHLQRDAALANAPEAEEGHFIVPKVIE